MKTNNEPQQVDQNFKRKFLWWDEVSNYKKLSSWYAIGYLVGLLQGHFDLPEDINPEDFVHHMIECGMNPFDVGVDKCLDSFIMKFAVADTTNGILEKFKSWDEAHNKYMEYVEQGVDFALNNNHENHNLSEIYNNVGTFYQVIELS